MVGFTREDATRVARATRLVEKMVLTSDVGTHRRPTGTFVGFWAKITERDSGGKKYSWKQLGATDEDKLDENEELLEGDYSNETGYAIEANESKWVLKDEIVWLEPAATEDYYVFHYHPGVRIAKTGSDDIPAMTGSTLGSGEVTIYRKDSSAGSLTSTSDTITAYNTMGVVTKNKFVQITYAHADAVWYVTAEDCR